MVHSRNIHLFVLYVTLVFSALTQFGARKSIQSVKISQGILKIAGDYWVTLWNVQSGGLYDV